MWCQSSRDPSENSHYMIIPAHTPNYAFNLPILYRKLHVIARILYKSSTIANIIQNTRKLCKDVIFLNAPRSALIHRGDDYVGQIMQENDSRAVYYALHYAIHTHDYALCSWEILASGARWCGERSAIYISDRFCTLVLALAAYTHIGNYVRKITWPGQWSSHQTNSNRIAAT